MDVMKNYRSSLIRAAWLVAILVAFTIFINLSWFDEDLHPELARLIEPQPVSMQGNAYPLLYGFQAATGQDARAAGERIIEELRERYENRERVTLSSDEIDEILGNPDSLEIWNTSFGSVGCNARFELDCADRLIAEVAQSTAIHPRLQLMLDRYEAILRQPRFEENQEFDAYTPLPAYGPVMGVARIRLAMSYLNGSTEEFLSDISADIAFWKLMLRDGQSLVAKMVALAGLRNDTTFLSTLMRDRDLSSEALQAVASVLRPLTDEERDIGETFLAEMRIALLSSKSLAIVFEGPSLITRLALQEQATLNRYFLSATTPLRLRAALSATDFYRQRGQDQIAYSVRAFPPPLYNLGGEFILKWTAYETNTLDYISRVHDLDGRISLILLQAEIALNSARRAEDVVRSSVYRNPYTLEPMDYDRQAQTVGFDCLANPEDACSVRISQQ